MTERRSGRPGTGRTRRAESSLTLAAEKLARALTEVRAEVENGPWSHKEYVRGVRDHLYTSAAELKTALEMLHGINGGDDR